MYKVNGYVKRFLWEYIKQQYPVYIYRPGNITGHSQSGFCMPDNNHALRLLKGFIQSKTIPNWNNQYIEMTPVDLIRKIIVTLIHRPISNNKQIFNLHNIHNISWQPYMEQVSHKLNLQLKIVRDKEWCKNILPTLGKGNALYPFKDLYMEEQQYTQPTYPLSVYPKNFPRNLADLYPSYKDYFLQKFNFI